MTPRPKTSITNTNNGSTDSNAELDNRLANNRNHNGSQAILADEHREKSITGRNANYGELSNPQIITLIRQRDRQITYLQEKDTQNINKVTELEAALAQTSFTTADQMPKTEIKDVVTHLQEFEADKHDQAFYEEKQLLQSAIWYIAGLQKRLKLHSIRLVIEEKEFPEQKPR